MLQSWLETCKNKRDWKQIYTSLDVESRPSIKIFKKMSDDGFVTYDSQEGIQKRGNVPMNGNLYRKIYQRVAKEAEKEEEEEKKIPDEENSETKYFGRQKMRW